MTQLRETLLTKELSAIKTPARLYQNRLNSFGRFLSIRKTYSFCQNLRQRLNSEFYKERLKIRDKSIFEEIKVDTFVEELRQKGVSFGLQLPAALVENIYQYALQIPCTEPKFDKYFLIGDVKNGYLQCGHQVVRALISDVTKCSAIKQIVRDPLLLQIVREYLNYWPTRITEHLTWSVASNLSDAEIKLLYPPTNYHYDLAGINFMTVYFYITDVDSYSGPHIMIEGSHNDKPLHFTLHSGRHSEKSIFEYYDKKNEIEIKGKRGFGFVQDPSCFHKLKAPVTKNRLLLQIRYS